MPAACRRSTWRPVIPGALSENRTESAEGERGSVSGVYDQTVNAGLDLGWTLFDGFRVQTNYKRLEELRGLGEVNARIAIEDFVAGLTAEYYNYVQQKIRLKNFLYAVSLSKERLRIVEARYRIGNFSRLDLQQARVDFNADSSQYINQQELVQASLIRLNELMAGPDVNAPLQICDSLIRVNSRLEEGELLKRMLQTNASLLKADRNTALAGLDLKTLQARNYPYVKLNAGYGYQLNRYGNNANRQRQTWARTSARRSASRCSTATDGANNATPASRSKTPSSPGNSSNCRCGPTWPDFWQAYRNNLELLKLEEENLVAATENHEIARSATCSATCRASRCGKPRKACWTPRNAFSRRNTTRSCAKSRYSRSAETFCLIWNNSVQFFIFVQ